MKLQFGRTTQTEEAQEVSINNAKVEEEQLQDPTQASSSKIGPSLYEVIQLNYLDE